MKEKYIPTPDNVSKTVTQASIDTAKVVSSVSVNTGKVLEECTKAWIEYWFPNKK